MLNSIKSASILAALLLTAGTAHAQGLSVSLRGGGGLPLERMMTANGEEPSEEALLEGAKSGFGYGADVTLSLGRRLGLYAGFDQVRFDCEEEKCGSEGRYDLGGVSAGVKLAPVSVRGVRPWVKGGVTFSDLRGEYGGTAHSRRLTTDRAPGYEVAVGVDVSLLGMFVFAPQARYVGQNLRYRIPGVDSPTPTEHGVGYVRFDLGFGFRSPFGGGGGGVPR